MIIQALISKGKERPVIELITNEFEEDVHFYKNFWIEPAIVEEKDGYSLKITVPDRQENLAIIDIIPDDIIEYLKNKLPESNYKIEIIFREFEGSKIERLKRPGDIPVSFDFSGKISEYMAKFREGEVDEAVSILDLLEKENKKFPFINLYKAELFIRTNKIKEAEECLEKEFAACPDNFIAYCSAGYLYRMVGNSTKSKELYIKSLTIYPNYINAILSITYLFSAPEELEIIFARAYKINPTHPAIEQLISEREVEFGDKTTEQIIESISKKSAKINISSPMYIPGVTKEKNNNIDPTAGDLTKEEVFKFCLEEIIMDGKLNDREKRTLNEIKRALEIDDITHRKIFKEVELNFRQKKIRGEEELNDKVLYKRIIERVLADGKVSKEEKELLKKVSFVLMIDKEAHQAIVKEVMKEKGFNS